MAKPDTRFKRTTNRLLDHIRESCPRGAALPGEEALAVLSDVSRTTVRAALTHIEGIGIVERRQRMRRVVRRPRKTDYFEVSELVSRSDQIQRAFMERFLRRNLSPGQAFSETELAREASVSPPSAREFLVGFSRFGLIERKPKGGWILRAFDAKFARELADMRETLEMRAIEQFRIPPEDPAVATEIASLAERHREMQGDLDRQHAHFQDLDRELHTMLIRQLDNRFAESFYDIISFVFHYHYQWNKADRRGGSELALREHLAILDALADRDVAAARTALGIHLATARQTLMRSIDFDRSAQPAR